MSLLKRLLLMGGALLLTGLLIIFPKEALEASKNGLDIWWKIVFPSLLPFFIMSELLIRLGTMNIIGRIFEPFMRPLFHVPGIGSLAFIMGMVSGYPTGAKITSRLREEKKLTQIEAERLISFTNAASPLFIFGAIAIGFFNDARIGTLLALSHYGGNFIVGLIIKYVYTDQKKYSINNKKGKLFQQVIQDLKQTTEKESKKPLGEILGNSIYHSIQTLLMIGGFITFFSVSTQLLLTANILPMLAQCFEIILSVLSVPAEMSIPFLTGLFEVTIGVQNIAKLKFTSSLQLIIFISFLLGFNGFSIQSQVASMISKTDIRFSRYFYSRLLHGFTAGGLTYVLYHYFFQIDTISVSDFHKRIAESLLFIQEAFHFLTIIGPIITILSIGYACYYQMRQFKIKN
ncbi:MAG TPA: sporulation integral membrane protein YlbJ [Bacillota bacterium]|nr:sporulation integral membrane protein YlbJ [Bacillota bacterium]